VVLLGKPAPAIYEAAMEMLEVENPKEVLAIGDSMEHDIAGHTQLNTKSAILHLLSKAAICIKVCRVASCASSVEESIPKPMTQNACVAECTDRIIAPVCGCINMHEGLWCN